MFAMLGRMHVIVIHFPVALLLMAALGEVWGQPARWSRGSLFAGALGAVVAMGLGWMLVWFAGYEATPLLRWHQIFGTATAGVAVVAAGVYWRIGDLRRSGWRTGVVLGAGLLVGVTGHLGGMLVHGSLLMS